MAKEYFEKLSTLIYDLKIEDAVDFPIEVKHFFSGAALYANETICASYSPVGLAFKLPESEVRKLIGSGQANPLKYFANGRVKKGYALFENPDQINSQQLKKQFLMAVQQVSVQANAKNNPVE